MGTTIQISSVNYNGQTADITFYPDTGGTISLGSQILPYTVELNYIYGTYELYFPLTDNTCFTYLTQSTYYLLQEDGGSILQENGFNLLWN